MSVRWIHEDCQTLEGAHQARQASFTGGFARRLVVWAAVVMAYRILAAGSGVDAEYLPWNDTATTSCHYRGVGL